MKKKTDKIVADDKSSDIINNKQDNSPIIPQRSKLKSTLKIYQREFTEKQKQFLSIASSKDTK